MPTNDRKNSWLKDSFNRKIRLTKERSKHIQQDHPEMARQFEKIKETLLHPEKITRSKVDSNASLFYKLFDKTPVTRKYMCVIIKQSPDDFYLLTAYFTDRIKKSEVIWVTK